MATTMDTTDAPARARRWAPRLKALADENRLTIALLLADREHSVKELQDATSLSQTLVSHHLGVLREHGLVSVRADGRSNRYLLCCSELLAIITALSDASPDACP